MTRLATTLAASAALACSISTASAQCAAPAFFRAEGSTVRNNRAVNDLVLPLGNGGDYLVSRLSTRLTTNCAPGFEVWFEVYDSDLIGRPWHRLGQVKATSIAFTGRTFIIGGLSQAEIRASVTFPSTTAVIAAAGNRIWVGAFVRNTFSFLERANAIADTTKRQSTKTPMLQTAIGGPWTSAPAGTCDLAIDVGVKQYCRADLNRDGFTNQADWTLYMQAWLMHSPLADFNRNGLISIEDRAEFFAEYNSGCTTAAHTY